MLDLEAVASEPRRRPAARHPKAGRASARAGRQPQAAAARRTGGRAQSRGGRRARQPHSPGSRRAPGHRAARRAPHEPGDGGVRQSRRARFRPQDRRRHAGEVQQDQAVIHAYLGTGGSTIARPPWGCPMMLEVAASRRVLWRASGAVRGRARASTGAGARPCSAPTAPARRQCFARSAAWCRPQATSVSTAGASTAGRPRTSCASASPMFQRAAARSSASRSKRTCGWAPTGATRRGIAGFRADLQPFSATQGTSPSAGRHASGGEQQMLAVSRA